MPREWWDSPEIEMMTGQIPEFKRKMKEVDDSAYDEAKGN